MLRSAAVAALLAGATAAWADTIEEKAALCSACHGEKGLPEDPATPIIWGQNEAISIWSSAISRRAPERTIA